jgi:hypothetical protein
VTEGDLELLQVVVSMAVTLPAVAAIIAVDERRLRGPALERAWPPVSRDAAIFGLWNLGIHLLCIPLHFVRTRRSLAGLALGTGWLMLVIAAEVGAQVATAAVVGWAGL